MFTLKSINNEIYDLEDGRMTDANVDRLANLYIIRDHLLAEYGDNTKQTDQHSQSDWANDMCTTELYESQATSEPEPPEPQPLFGPPKSKKPVMSVSMANEWVGNMVNADGTRGGHWTLENAKQIIKAKNLDVDPIKFWVAMCATYSDLCEAFKKNGVGNNLSMYVDTAMAFWLNDEDAVEDKLAAYYVNVVQH